MKTKVYQRTCPRDIKNGTFRTVPDFQRLELTQTQSEQALQDFRLNVLKMVRQYNLQAYRVKIAYRTRETTLRRYDVARWLYLQGRTSLLEFNTSINEKDNAQRAFISALQTYWSLYYGLRSLTLKQ